MRSYTVPLIARLEDYGSSTVTEAKRVGARRSGLMISGLAFRFGAFGARSRLSGILNEYPYYNSCHSI